MTGLGNRSHDLTEKCATDAWTRAACLSISSSLLRLKPLQLSLPDRSWDPMPADVYDTEDTVVTKRNEGTKMREQELLRM